MILLHSQRGPVKLNGQMQRIKVPLVWQDPPFKQAPGLQTRPKAKNLDENINRSKSSKTYTSNNHNCQNLVDMHIRNCFVVPVEYMFLDWNMDFDDKHSDIDIDHPSGNLGNDNDNQYCLREKRIDR